MFLIYVSYLSILDNCIRYLWYRHNSTSNAFHRRYLRDASPSPFSVAPRAVPPDSEDATARPDSRVDAPRPHRRSSPRARDGSKPGRRPAPHRTTARRRPRGGGGRAAAPDTGPGRRVDAKSIRRGPGATSLAVDRSVSAIPPPARCAPVRHAPGFPDSGADRLRSVARTDPAPVSQSINTIPRYIIWLRVATADRGSSNEPATTERRDVRVTIVCL